MTIRCAASLHARSCHVSCTTGAHLRARISTSLQRTLSTPPPPPGLQNNEMFLIALRRRKSRPALPVMTEATAFSTKYTWPGCLVAIAQSRTAAPAPSGKVCRKPQQYKLMPNESPHYTSAAQRSKVVRRWRACFFKTCPDDLREAFAQGASGWESLPVFYDDEEDQNVSPSSSWRHAHDDVLDRQRKEQTKKKSGSQDSQVGKSKAGWDLALFGYLRIAGTVLRIIFDIVRFLVGCALVWRD